MGALWDGITHLLAPRVCRVCQQSLITGEDVLCLNCSIDMPRAKVHTDNFNIIHQRLGHNCKVDRAAGWFYYRKESPYAQMLVDAKYNQLPGLAKKLGKMCADELSTDHFFDGIDYLVPMPMHWRKRLMRGYNQAEEIARGIGEVTGINIAYALKASKSHGIQSRKNKTQRYASIAGTLALDRQSGVVSGKHALIIDDIITTGASISEAARTLTLANPSNISVLCLGLTTMR